MWLDALVFTNRLIRYLGSAMPQRPAFNFVGDGVSVADDIPNQQTTITIAGGGGGSVPSGSGFFHITGGVADAAARAVDLATTDVTGVLALAHLGAPTGTGRPKLISGAWQAAASAIDLAGGSSEVTGVLPLANVGAPTGSGVALVSGGAWSGAAGLVDLATQVTGTLPVANGGFDYGAMFLSPAQVGQNVGVSENPGDYTLGCRFLILRRVSWRGVRLYTSVAGQNWKVRAYNATGTTTMASATATGVAAGITDILFGSPVSITNLSNIYTASAYCFDGSHVAGFSPAAAPTYWAPGLWGGAVWMLDTNYYAAGDAAPTSSGASALAAMEPILVAA